MPTQKQIDNIDNLPAKEKVLLALRALAEYKQLIGRLTASQRQILLNILKRKKEIERTTELAKVEEEIHHLFDENK